MCAGQPRLYQSAPAKESIVNRIIWLVGAVVIILFVLSFFGLR